MLVHHESSAVCKAHARARSAGKFGVCMTTLGPGAANAVACLAHGFGRSAHSENQIGYTILPG
jgi:thiamine pyrophosphate-dependent acetolactate synthase large subunit-like protein